MSSVSKGRAARPPKTLIAGNWKMNGTRKDLSQVRALRKVSASAAVDIAICPPATLLGAMREAVRGSKISLGGQDCHPQTHGAHTGDISAEMMKGEGAKYVIVGHSERRSDHGENNKTVASKVVAAHRAGLVAIMCLGETLAERKKGDALKVIGQQLRGSLPKGVSSKNTVIAYEPVWAIGTGLTPTSQEIAQAHAHLRRALVRLCGTDGHKFRILYGGSVKPDNATEILALPNVNGALVGGASLKAKDFGAIIKAGA
jgi:triosephosphate isomerase